MEKINLVLNKLIKLKGLIKIKNFFSEVSDKKKEIKTILDLPDEYNEHLVMFLDPRSPVIEQYRSLRTHLLAESGNKSINTFLVTSSIRGEGKSITSCNLGIILAHNRQNSVLLVDGDMRIPSIHKIFGIRGNRGLVDYLKGESELDSLIVPTKIDNLFILPAGEPQTSPSELLATSKMTDFLRMEESKGKNHYVIIDSPPIISTTDPRIIATYVGGVLLVVQAGRTPRDVISHGLSLLKNVNILGIILNNISGISPYYPYRYSYAYGYVEYSK